MSLIQPITTTIGTMPSHSQSAYRVEKTVTGADMGLDRLSDPSDPLYISDDAPAKLSDAKDFFYDQDNDTFWVCDSGNNRIRSA